LEADDSFSGWLLQLTNNALLTDFAAVCSFVVILLCFAAVLSAAENAVVYLSQEDPNKAEESASKKDKIRRYLNGRLRLMRASCSMVRTVIVIAVTVLCVYGISLFHIASSPLVLLIAFVSAIILWALFNGLAPKLLANHKLGVARLMAPLLKGITKTGAPLLRLTSVPVGDTVANETFRKKQVPLAGEAPNDVYEKKEMLEEIIHFYNKKANEIMTPRTDMMMIDIRCNIKEIVDVIVRSGYSRIPVYENNEDHIKGVLFAKDIIPLLDRAARLEWQSLIRPPFFVPESKKIYDLLDELRAGKMHIAIVVDEFGCTSGIVTMEDIIEEIIGDISDEYDDDDHTYMQLPDGSYIFEGKTQLNDFFRETGIPAANFNDLTEEAETLTGLMLAIKGTLPQRREVIDYKSYRFHILEADERRVLKIKVGAPPRHQETTV
jgi:gliding motility-associated protein GldE